MSEDLSKLNLVDLLDRLEPIPEPPAVSFWPQTAGWIWAVLGLVGLAFVCIRWGLRIHRASAYRRAALRELAAAGSDPAAIAHVIRRTALAAFERSRVAALHGEAWLAFLDRSYGGNGFQNGPGRIIASAPYRDAPETGGLADLAADWIRCHGADRQ